MLHITNFQNVPSSDVFLIGPYVGSRKPANEDDYMGDFVSGKTFRYALVRSFMCGTPGTNSFIGCMKFNEVGKHLNKVTVYSE